MVARPALGLPALPTGRTYGLHTMIKPTGALCNMDCPYCFYLHRTERLDYAEIARMSDAVPEHHIREYIEDNTGDEAVFSSRGVEDPKNRRLLTPDGEPGSNYLGAALERFCARMRRGLPEIRQRLGMPQPPTLKPGRQP